jgi:hypothetical protein
LNKESLPQYSSSTQESTRGIEHISNAEERAFNLLLPKHRELAINMDDFKNIYSPDEIDRDKESIKNKRSRMEGLDSAVYKRAQLLEAILAEQIELSNWFGENVMTIIPAEYDDLFNGVDMTAEFEKDGYFQYAAMGIDVTSSGHPVRKKLETIKQHIRAGDLTRMKYFQSEKNDIQGTYGKIPQLVIGADARTINELSNLWLTIHDSRHPSPELSASEVQELKEQAKEAQEKLANHRAAILILKELKAQLEVFIEYARLIKSEEIEEKYKNLLKLVTDTLSEKKVTKNDEIKNEIDDVYSSIRKELEIFLAE